MVERDRFKLQLAKNKTAKRSEFYNGQRACTSRLKLASFALTVPHDRNTNSCCVE